MPLHYYIKWTFLSFVIIIYIRYVRYEILCNVDTLVSICVWNSQLNMIILYVVYYSFFFLCVRIVIYCWENGCNHKNHIQNTVRICQKQYDKILFKTNVIIIWKSIFRFILFGWKIHIFVTCFIEPLKSPKPFKLQFVY